MTTKTASDRLKEMDLEPQEALAPVANYVPYVRAGSLVFVSGQLPLKDGQLLHTGLVGDSVSPEEGQAAAARAEASDGHGVPLVAPRRARTRRHPLQIFRCVSGVRPSESGQNT